VKEDGKEREKENGWMWKNIIINPSPLTARLYAPIPVCPEAFHQHSTENVHLRAYSD
jgi:hypothetical protein